MAATEIELPLEVIRQSCGFSFDIGGSVAKIIYRSKEDFLNGEPRKPEPGQKTGIIRLRLWPRKQIDEVIEFIKENVDFTTHNGKTRINTTGVGGNLWKKKMEAALGIAIENKIEFDCFTKAFKFTMDNLTPEQLFHHIPDKDVELFEKFTKVMGNFMETHKAKNEAASDENTTKFEFGTGENLPTDVKTLLRKIPDPYLPCMLAMCGSGVGFTYINEKREAAIIEGTSFGGRLFLGLGAALTGVKDFDELMEMAARGDGKSVDQFTSDVMAVDVDDPYSKFLPADVEDLRVFAFGKAAEADRESLKPDDMAQSILTLICETIAQVLMNCCKNKEVHNIFFCGNFINHPKSRELLLLNMHMRAILAISGQCNVQFLRHGGFLGGLGAFMTPPSEDKPEEGEKDTTAPQSEPAAEGTDRLTQGLTDTHL